MYFRKVHVLFWDISFWSSGQILQIKFPNFHVAYIYILIFEINIQNSFFLMVSELKALHGRVLQLFNTYYCWRRMIFHLFIFSNPYLSHHIRNLLSNEPSSHPSNHEHSTITLRLIPESPSCFQPNGRNYLVWFQLVQIFLKGKGKLSHLIRPTPDQENPKFNIWDEEDCMIRS